MSRPRWSSPSGCAAEGGCSLAARSCAVAWSAGMISGPTTAINRRSATTTSPKFARRFICLQLLHPDSWIEPAIEHVGERVHHHVRDRDHEEAALRERVVSLVDRLDEEAAESGPVEDDLRDDRAGEKHAELEAEDGDDRNETVLEDVLVEHGSLREPLCL